ncbi:hypothetical protein RMDY18_06920 [Rothia mucilaginosa DY-18]|uniref:Uncharacterized protein n=1 Tax=Rothia mucilaginosa (strain DY-18) TaxID=680646 RepID=D2NS98_ROTMD|nr:hypothetical protein RMDY18_06920 [Rothia mucilaginosa DY-18]
MCGWCGAPGNQPSPPRRGRYGVYPPQNLKVQTHERQAREDRKNYGQRQDEKHHRGEHRDLLLTGCFHQLTLSVIAHILSLRTQHISQRGTALNRNSNTLNEAAQRRNASTLRELLQRTQQRNAGAGLRQNLRKLTSQLAARGQTDTLQSRQRRLARRYRQSHHLRQRRELSNQLLLTLSHRLTQPPVTRQKAAQTTHQHQHKSHQDRETLLHHTDNGQGTHDGHTGKSPQQLLSTKRAHTLRRASTTQTLLHRTITQRRAAQRRRQRTQKRRAERRNRLQQARLTAVLLLQQRLTQSLTAQLRRHTIRKRNTASIQHRRKNQTHAGRQQQTKNQRQVHPKTLRSRGNSPIRSIRRYAAKEIAAPAIISIAPAKEL